MSGYQSVHQKEIIRMLSVTIKFCLQHSREVWKIGHRNATESPQLLPLVLFSGHMTPLYSAVQCSLIVAEQVFLKDSYQPAQVTYFVFHFMSKAFYLKYYTLEYESDWHDWTWPNLFLLPVLSLVTSDSKLVSPAPEKKRSCWRTRLSH